MEDAHKKAKYPEILMISCMYKLKGLVTDKVLKLEYNSHVQSHELLLEHIGLRIKNQANFLA